MGVVVGEGDRSNSTHHFILLQHLHVLDGDSGNLAFSRSNQNVSIGQNSDTIDPQTEELFDWTNPFVDSLVDVNLENVSCLCSAVNILVCVVDGCTRELSPHVAEVCVQRLDLFVDLVDSQNLDSIVEDGDHFVAVVVEEVNFVDDLFVWGTVEAFSGFYIPNNQHVPGDKVECTCPRGNPETRVAWSRGRRRGW